MICEKCHQREASVHYTEIINGRKKEAHLCQECAEKGDVLKGFRSWKQADPFGNSLFGHSFFRDFWDVPGEALRQTVCPTCGLTSQEFREEGKLGCADCYKTFRDQLIPFFRKSQEGIRHTGNSPVQGKEPVDSPEIAALKKQLEALVAEEKYEEAAHVRDLLKQKEGEQHDHS